MIMALQGKKPKEIPSSQLGESVSNVPEVGKSP
jgi:hypothetical protein